MLPILRRFPALAALPRVNLGSYPTPIQHAEALARGLWIKRDDLSALPIGGNKVRALEFLLGGVAGGDCVVTVGAVGSTHALATAIYATRLGAHPILLRWPQVLNPVAEAVSRRIGGMGVGGGPVGSVVSAYARAFVARARGAHWVPAGGSSSLGVLGHVNAALELIEQVAAGEMPAPRRLIAPLGSGGTLAGLLLGFRIAGVDCEVIGARVTPSIVANRRRVVRLANATGRFIGRLAGERVPRVDGSALRVVHDVYGGAYGQPVERGEMAAQHFLRWSGNQIDATYAAKALAVTLGLADGSPTLFWLTFDGRWLAEIGTPDASGGEAAT